MKNKIKLKRYLYVLFIISICSLVMFVLINVYQYNTYKTAFNNKISEIISVLNEKYPKLSETEIIEILNNDTNNTTDIFQKYGIDIKNDSILIENDKNHYRFLLINMLFIIVIIVILIFIFLLYEKMKDKDIKDITNYIEQINRKNYELNIDSISEDELSILKNEIYKTTVMLKESAENSNLDKINLKKSLEDISHQLKTPLTSIFILLDNLIDDPDMDICIRNDFIRDIKREITNINFLVQSILKLSKFDANTINFIKGNVNVTKIIDEAVKNISTLCDLKNIDVYINGDDNCKIYCDFKWQVEAITNILKNCVDHSKEGEKIEISYEENSVYTMIKIRDFGVGISKKDLPYIFDRFYKGENSATESIGIGLALSKTIIKEDNGYINVKPLQKGTAFIIKYFKI